MKYRTGLKSNAQIQEAVQELLAGMTLAEKLGQMTQSVGADIVYIGTTTQSESVEGWIRSGLVGSMIQVDEPRKLAEKIRRYQKIAVEESRLGIPLLFAQDVIHGFETVFPIPLAWSSSFDPELIRGAAAIAAKEASACGINYVYSPMVDIAHDPRWGRVAEGAGEDPCLGARIAQAIVEGFQGKTLGESDRSVAACLKHYLGYGAAEGGRDYNTAEFSRTAMYNTYLSPFRAGVAAGAASVMTAFNVIDGVPAVANKPLLEGVLRGELGFDGVVISDYNAVMELMMHGVAASPKEAAEKSLDAGLDIEMTTTYFKQYGEQIVRKHPELLEKIDCAAARVLTLKYRLGLMDDPYRYLRENEIDDVVFSTEHLDYSQKVAENSAVLLKNDGILPLRRGQRVALIGPFADSTDLCGCWSFSTRRPETRTLREGFENLGWTVTVEAGSGVNEPLCGGLERAVALAEKSDVVILALGENDVMSGESCCRMHITVPQAQQELAERVQKTGVPTVLCLMNGRPLLLNWYAEHCAAILQCYQLGSRAGSAIARLLTGAANPCGKLTMTVPMDVGQIPLYYNHLPTGRPLDDEDSQEHFLSRYLDGPNRPLYPFGYGLSYTSFRLSDLKLDRDTIRLSETATLSVTVQNTGEREGGEVVQLYMRDVAASVSRPVRELKGFCKVQLAAGEQKTLEFQLDADMMSFYDTKGERRFEPGVFRFTVGTSSADKNSLRTELKVIADEV